LFGVLRGMTGAVGRSAVVAALFAVHPLHVESVAWVAERKDVLSTLGGLLTLAAYARYAAWPSVGRYLVVVWTLTLGLLAKPMLVTLPCVLLLLDYWPLRRFRLAGPADGAGEGAVPAPRFVPARPGLLVAEKVPLLILVLLASLVTVHAQKQVGAVLPTEPIPLPVRLGNALVSYVQYLRQTFWPQGLSIFYPHPFHELSSWPAAGSALLLGMVTVLVLRQARQRPYLVVGWFWFLGTLVPVIGLIQAGEQGRADRFTYVPHIGLFILLVWGSAELLARWPRPVQAALAAAVLAGCTVGTWLQVRHWRNSLTLWEHAIRVDPDNPRAHANLGSLLFDQGRVDEAVEHLERSVQLDPGVAETQFLLAALLLRQERLDEAARHFARAAQLRPHWADAHFKLGVICLRQGKPDEAAGHFARAARLDPGTAAAVNQLGLALGGQGKWREAGQCFQIASNLLPGSAEYRFNLARALHAQGHPDEAVHLAEQALTLARSAGPTDLVEAIEQWLRRGRGRPRP
ncbi:MAG TPA: tetratricopeptide repeat protein, partial [Gemmataceae bacterium]|nr:tetratricopeptide repeat protein [Gemmataceae bacterium]